MEILDKDDTMLADDILKKIFVLEDIVMINNDYIKKEYQILMIKFCQ